MEKHKSMKNYMKSLYSQCAVIPFLQESYILKYLSKTACSEANRWSFETQREHETFISTTLPTSHTKSMHTLLSTHKEDTERKGEVERWGDFAVQNKAQNKLISYFSFSQNTSHQRTETGLTADRKKINKSELASSQNIQNKEKTDARREKRQTVTFKSHQRIMLLEAMLFLFRQFLKSIN